MQCHSPGEDSPKGICSTRFASPVWVLEEYQTSPIEQLNTRRIAGKMTSSYVAINCIDVRAWDFLETKVDGLFGQWNPT